MDDKTPLAWQYRAWEKDPSRRFVAVAFMLLAGLGGMMILHHVLFALIGIVVVFVSTAELFLPVKYRLDEAEASQKIGFSTTSIRWSEVKRLIPQGGGVRLSPFEESNRLDAFRGLFLRYTGNEALVLGKIRALWKSDARSLERNTEPGEEGGSCGEGGTSRPQAQNGDPSYPVSGDA